MNESSMKVLDIPMSDIYCDDDFNCRGSIAPMDVIDLARSIKENGLQQPITVQPFANMPGKKFRIVSGHRRYIAHKVNDAKTIPSIVKEGLTEMQARKLNLDENLKRQDLNMLQEAKAIWHFKLWGLTQDDVAKEIGQSRGWVQVRFMILDLPPEIQQEVAAGFLTQSQIRELHGLPRAQQFEAVKRVKESKLAGEKRSVQVKKPKVNPLSKRVRKREEMFDLIEKMGESIGYGLHTRALAWAAGEISDLELYRSMKEHAEEQGKTFEIPREALAALI